MLRNVLHLGLSYCENFLNLRNEEKALLDFSILRNLLNNIALHILNEKDKLFEWNCFDYALKTNSIFPFEIIAEVYEGNETLLSYLQYIFKHFEDSKLLDCCCRLGYPILLKAFFREKKSSKIKLNKDLILQAAEQYTESKYEYSKEKYKKTVQILTRNGCDVNERDDDGSTLLHILCQQGDIKKVKGLLNCTNIDAFAINNHNNKTALHFASESHNSEIVEMLIEKGLSVNDLDKNDWTPLQYACKYGSCEVIKTLLEHNADIDVVTNNKASILHLAAMNVKPEIITFLINKGMQVNQVDINNCTPLHYACRHGSCEVIKTLLEHKSDINAVTNGNVTMLHLATMNGKPEIITFLINKGMQVNLVDFNDWTPLHYASSNGSCEVIKTLLEHNADISAVTSENATILHLAARNSKSEIITFLINQGMQVNLVNKNNWTPLHYASRFGSCEVINKLIEHKADINAVTKGNLTMLHLAAANNKPDIVTFLTNKGMQVNEVDIDDLTPLHYASRYGSCEIFKTLLLEPNADINAVSKCGETMLHLASRNENIDVLQFLLAEGISINIFDNSNHSPLYDACMVSNYRAVEILLERGIDLDSNCQKILFKKFHLILCLGNVSTVKSLLKGMKKERIDIEHLPPDFPIHLAIEEGQIQPSLLLKITRHIKEFRETYGSANYPNSKLYKYLIQKFENVSPQEIQEAESIMDG